MPVGLLVVDLGNITKNGQSLVRQCEINHAEYTRPDLRIHGALPTFCLTYTSIFSAADDFSGVHLALLHMFALASR